MIAIDETQELLIGATFGKIWGFFGAGVSLVCYQDPNSGRRNQPCPCCSDKKYKHCCGRHELSPSERLLREAQKARQGQNYNRSGYRT